MYIDFLAHHYNIDFTLIILHFGCTNIDFFSHKVYIPKVLTNTIIGVVKMAVTKWNYKVIKVDSK